MSDMLERTSALANRASEWLLVPLVVGFVAVVAWSVFTRYVLHYPIVESVELARLGFVWSSFLAIAIGARRRAHVAIVAFERRMPPAARGALRRAVHLLAAGFGVLMAVYGTRLALQVAPTSFPTLGWSQAWLYVPLAVSGALIALHALAAATGPATDAEATAP